MLTARRLLGALLAGGVLATAACGVSGNPVPAANGTAPNAPSASISPAAYESPGDAAFKSIALTWRTGSVPPPYNYSLTLSVTGDSAKLVWATRYSANDSQWTGEFKLDATQVATVNSAVVRMLGPGWKDSDDGSVGGPSASYSVVAADGSIREDSSAIADVVDSIESLLNATVPKSVYSELEAEYQAWQKAQK